MLEELDELFLNRTRLGIMSILVAIKEAEFSWIQEELQCTSGNLSIQLQKLQEAGYIEIEKKFRDKYPLTLCKITKKGIQAFEKHFENLNKYRKFKKNKKYENKSDKNI